MFTFIIIHVLLKRKQAGVYKYILVFDAFEMEKIVYNILYRFK